VSEANGTLGDALTTNHSALKAQLIPYCVFMNCPYRALALIGYVSQGAAALALGWG